MKVLVTGASGFVGRALCQQLKNKGYLVTAAVRSETTAEIEGAAQTIVIGDIGSDTDWSKALIGQQAIFHLAARAHVMNEDITDPETLYRQVNVDGTAALLEQAKAAQVNRLIFLSSIKVNGEQTTGQPFNEQMELAPEDAYGRTKRDAEIQIRNDPQIKSTILRSPLVYGPGVKGNFLKLIGLCQRAWPLPLASIENKRSLIYLDNLVDALIHTLEHAESMGQTYLLSDGQDVSTPDLIRLMAEALQKPSRLFPVPVFMLKFLGVLASKSAAIQRLSGSLQIDSRHIQQHLGWKPPVHMQQGLEKTANWYQNQP